jgi:putative oxidoreductase
MSFLAPYSEFVFAALRIVAGILFALHGSQKLFGVPGGAETRKYTRGNMLLTIAGIIEILGGTFIAIGLFSAPAAFIASGQMAVAYFKAHAPKSFWPIVNGGELTVLFCFLFLFIAAHGSGILSIDSLLH